MDKQNLFPSDLSLFQNVIAVFLILFDRSDFMTLPFQACECYMANITPLQGMRLKQCWKKFKIFFSKFHYLSVYTNFVYNKIAKIHY